MSPSLGASKGFSMISLRPVSRLVRRARSARTFRLPYSRQSILGKELWLRSGTIRRPSDYDDAWGYTLISRSRIFFDVGCGMGQFSVLAALQDPTRTVVAVDAAPSALAVTADNVIRNRLGDQVRLVLAQVGDSNEVAPGEVRKVTVDVLVDETGITPDLVKVDVEGAELDVLSGSSTLAKDRSARFIVELHTFSRSMTKNRDLVLEWCNAHEYDAYYLKEHRHLSESSSVAGRGRCHVLLQPQGWGYPEFLRAIPQGHDLAKVLS
jgi:hypothetical protein